MPDTRQGPSRTAKVSVTIDDVILREVRKVARRRGATLSAHVSETLAEDLRRRKLAKLIEEYEAEHGEITEAEISRVRASMRSACRVVVLSEPLARRAGELLAKVPSATPIDAVVTASAATRGDVVVTSDFDDLASLASHCSGIDVIGIS